MLSYDSTFRWKCRLARLALFSRENLQVDVLLTLSRASSLWRGANVLQTFPVLQSVQSKRMFLLMWPAFAAVNSFVTALPNLN